MPWKTFSSKKVYKNHWMEVVEDEVETDMGRKLTYGVVRKKPFVVLVPWDGTHLTLVRQYRYPIGRAAWKFPQGHLEHGSIEEAARAELREETGLRAKELKEIERLHLAASFSSQEGTIFLATGLTQGEAEREESEEDMEARQFTLEEFRKMIESGEMMDCPTIAAWGILVTKELLK